MRTIAFFSQKGGCGKTTSCVNIGVALAQLGRRVLIVDLDSNSCASRTFDAVETFDRSVAAALIGMYPLAEIIRETPIVGVWIAPGSADLISVERSAGIREDRLGETGCLSDQVLAAEVLELGQNTFDYVLLDCPGGHPFMEQLALLACDEVIVPTGLSIYDLYAATPSLQLIGMSKQVRGNGRPTFLGFLPNGAGKSGIPSKMQAKLDQYDAPCYSPVRHSGLLKSIAGMPKIEQRLIVLARPESAAAESYRRVALEIEMGIATARQALAVTESNGEETTDEAVTASS
jgi:cellulose biosynthesis protein BcsQ